VSERGISLSTQPATSAERRLALAVLLVSVVIFVIAAPFAKVPLAQVGAFIPIYESALVINDLITAVLLFGQFSFLGSRSLLALAAGYLFTAFITVAHALTFPGLFSPTGLLGAGQQSTAWLYMFWHSGFPLLVIAYAALKKDPQKAIGPGQRFRAAAVATIIVLVAVCALAFVATVGQGALPAIMEGNRTTRSLTFVVSIVWVMSLLALVALWRQRPRTVLDLWLMVVMCAWLFDIALSAMLNAGRFDLGFYAGRIYGLLASSFVLMVLLFDTSVLYGRLIEAHHNERRERQEVVEKTRELVAVNKELDAFSYSVSHDLRAPLRAVDGYTRMLEEDYGSTLDAEGKRLLGVVRASARQMGQLIDDLLAFSRVGREPVKRRPVQLEDLVHSVIGELRRDQGDREIEFLVGKLGIVEGDSALLKQALTNLLGNAIKFTGNKHPAVIEVGCQPQPAVGEPRVYYVKDNGAGFDMKYYDKLFGVFQRLHSAKEFPGTGVGLAIVNRVIGRHGGKVWAEARENEGATFYFTLRADSAGNGSASEADHIPG
jgi:signal transduction histidine kinase